MNPFLGVLFHWTGGLAAGSFYVPYKGVRNWSWETYWLAGGLFSWILCPWILAAVMTNDLWGVLARQDAATLGWTYFFGAMWGIGGLTFGLSMRYLGLSLGMGVALGYTAAFGTLLPPIFKVFIPEIPEKQDIVQIATSTPGQVVLFGVIVTLVGIFITSLAGLTKEKEMPEKEKQKTIKEFNFRKGILVATFAGIMSACFNFASKAGSAIADTSLAAGTPELWTGLPKLPIILAGGFTTNFIWCLFLSLKNRSGYEYAATRKRGPAPSDDPSGPADNRIPLLGNYLFCALAGATWYFQFFFYTMGETKMGKFDFSSWTLHMASIIIFSTLWGIYFKEWRGVSPKARSLVIGGIATLVMSTVIIGIGPTLAKKSEKPAAPPQEEVTRQP